MAETYGEDGGEPNTSPWVWKAGGQHFFWLALQTVGAISAAAILSLIKANPAYSAPPPRACHPTVLKGGPIYTVQQLLWDLMMAETDLQLL